MYNAGKCLKALHIHLLFIYEISSSFLRVCQTNIQKET